MPEAAEVATEWAIRYENVTAGTHIGSYGDDMDQAHRDMERPLARGETRTLMVRDVHYGPWVTEEQRDRLTPDESAAMKLRPIKAGGQP